MTTPFSLALAAALKAKRMRQSDLARAVGCGPASIGAYLSGASVPRRDRLARINEVLGVNLVPRKRLIVEDVAPLLGVGRNTMREDMRGGAFRQIGEAVPSRKGKRHRYYFYPAKVRELVEID